MNKGISVAQHYKDQRDILGYFLLETVGVSKEHLAKMLGISRQAVSFQFPTRKTK